MNRRFTICTPSLVTLISLLFPSLAFAIELKDTTGRLTLTMSDKGLITQLVFDGKKLPIAPSQTVIAGGNRWPTGSEVKTTACETTIQYRFREPFRDGDPFIRKRFKSAQGYILIDVEQTAGDLGTALIWKTITPPSPLNANHDPMAQHVKSQGSEVRSQKSGVGNQKSGGRSQKSGVENQKSEIRNQGSANTNGTEAHAIFIGLYPLNAESFLTSTIDEAHGNGLIMQSPPKVPRKQRFAFFAYYQSEHDDLLARIEQETGHPPLSRLFRSPENTLDTLFLHPYFGHPVNLDADKVCDYMDDPDGNGKKDGGFDKLILLHWLWCDVKDKDQPYHLYGWGRDDQWDVAKFITRCKARGKTVIAHVSPQYVLPSSYWPRKYPDKFLDWSLAAIPDLETRGEVFTLDFDVGAQMSRALAQRIELFDGWYTDHATGDYFQAVNTYAIWWQLRDDDYWCRITYFGSGGMLRYFDSMNSPYDFWVVRPSLDNMTLAQYYERLKKEAPAWSLFRGPADGQGARAIDFGWAQVYAVILPDKTQPNGYRTRPMTDAELDEYLGAAVDNNFPLNIKVSWEECLRSRADGKAKKFVAAIQARRKRYDRNDDPTTKPATATQSATSRPGVK